MGSHPLNLALRFLLEMSALLSMGLWGFRIVDGWPRFVLAIAIPVLAAIAWGTFAVPDDPSRSGAAPIAVPGILRLALELFFFAAGVWALANLGYTRVAWIMGTVVAMHYLVSYDRIVWLASR